MLRKIMLGLLVVFLILQAYRPERNTGEMHGPKSLFAAHHPPPAVERLLVRSCFDCHSNHTRYPWYSNVQPLGWWLQHHVNEGREALNFSIWADYKKEDMPHILEELQEEIEKGHMPLPSYLLLHNDAKLTPSEKDTVLHWAKEQGARFISG